MACRSGTLLVLALANTLTVATSALAEGEGESLSASFRKAARGVLPAVVTVRGLGGVAPLEPLPGRFGPARDGMPDAGGSGVVIDAARGYILTNDHVVPDVPRIVVLLPDGRQRTVKEVRRDARSDLALLIADPTGLVQAEWGDSEGLDLADWVLAVGQPFGLSGTVSAGIVSGPRRGLRPIGYDDLIQTSAAINPGSSGGPLVDLKGRVVGINVAIKTVTGGYEGVGFAVPAARARRVAADLAEFGRVRRAYLGVTIEPTDPEEAARDGGSSGAIVSSVAAGSPAEAAGLRTGDVILKVGGKAVSSPGAVRSSVEFAPIGEDLTLTIARDRESRDVSVKPTAIPEEPRPGDRAGGIGS